MKKRKEEILRNKEQPSVQSTEQPSAQSTVQSIDTHVYGVVIIAVLAIGVCVFFAYNTSQENKKLVNEKQDQPPKRRHML